MPLMNSHGNHKNGIFLVVFLISFLCARTSVLAAPVLSVNPSLTSTAPGESFSVAIDVSDISDFFAFQIGISFDPEILSATTVTEGDFLSTGGATFFIPGLIDNLSGLVSFSASTLLGPVSGVSGDGGILSIEFLSLSVGDSAISILIDPLDADGLLDSALNPIDVSVENGRAVIGSVAVTEPWTLLLVVSLLLGLALNGIRAKHFGWHRWQKNHNRPSYVR